MCRFLSSVSHPVFSSQYWFLTLPLSLSLPDLVARSLTLLVPKGWCVQWALRPLLRICEHKGNVKGINFLFNPFCFSKDGFRYMLNLHYETFRGRCDQFHFGDALMSSKTEAWLFLRTILRSQNGCSCSRDHVQTQQHLARREGHVLLGIVLQLGSKTFLTSPPYDFPSSPSLQSMLMT